MSLIYNNEDDQIIIDEALDEAETASPTQANDNTSPDKPEKMILPVISSVYSENPAEQHTDNRKEAFGCNNVATDGCQQDNDSHYSDSDVELVSVDYTNDTLSDSSQNNEISNIAQPIKKVRRKKRSTQKTEKAPKAPKQNPCQDKTCRNECNSFTEDERQVMFEEFKSLNEGEKRAYIQKWVNVKLPNHSLVNGNIIPGKMLREYYLLKQDQAIPIKVCCQFFCATLGVSPGTLRKALQGVFDDVNRSMDVTEENIALGNKTIRINVIDLIKQIQRKEEIWNPDMPIEDRLGVDESWNEICIALVEDYSKHFFQEQEYLKKRIVAKWCDIKSTYFQYSMRKRFIARINPGATPPFMAYSHLLSFLDQTKDFCLGASTEDCSSDKPDGFASVFIVGNNIETEPPEAPELEVCFAIGDDAQLAKKRRLETESNSYGVLSEHHTVQMSTSSDELTVNRLGVLNETQETVKVISTSINSGVVENEESDLIFFKSLLPIIKTLNHQQKLQFRLNVITTLQSLTQTGQVSASPSSQQNEFRQTEASPVAPQNPAVTSTSIIASKLSTSNVSENPSITETGSQDYSVLISSSDESDG